MTLLWSRLRRPLQMRMILTAVIRGLCPELGVGVSLSQTSLSNASETHKASAHALVQTALRIVVFVELYHPQTQQVPRFRQHSQVADPGISRSATSSACAEAL